MQAVIASSLFEHCRDSINSRELTVLERFNGDNNLHFLILFFVLFCFVFVSFPQLTTVSLLETGVYGIFGSKASMYVVGASLEFLEMGPQLLTCSL